MPSKNADPKQAWKSMDVKKKKAGLGNADDDFETRKPAGRSDLSNP
jgi:hypothetical protein